MILSFRRLLPFLRPFRRELILMFILGFGVTAIGGLLPVLIQTLLDVYGGKDLSTLQTVLPASVQARYPITGVNRDTIALWLPLAFRFCTSSSAPSGTSTTPC